jgi:hypothetical protein
MSLLMAALGSRRNLRLLDAQDQASYIGDARDAREGGQSHSRWHLVSVRLLILYHDEARRIL